MANPSDYRYKPYDDYLETVSLTEYHVIPNTSPYEVILNEVPQKNSPSTLMVYLNDSTLMTEVAATPAQGQYYPDYNTKADSDDNWNTGCLLFNSADAGKNIKVIYNGTGTLASVKSNRYPTTMTYCGNGANGYLNITANKTLSSGFYQYTGVNINSGVTLTLGADTTILVQGRVVNKGTISVSTSGVGGSGGTSRVAKSYWDNSQGENGTSVAVGSAGVNGGYAPIYGTIISGGGAGGAAGQATSSCKGGSGGSATNANIKAIRNNPADLGFYHGGAGSGGGSGGVYADYEHTATSKAGGSGGVGGGCLNLICSTFLNSGVIRANGGNGVAGGSGSASGSSTYSGGSGGGGGGGGGRINIIAKRILLRGTITANGGIGGTGGSGANGGTAGSAGSSGQAGIIIVTELGW